MELTTSKIPSSFIWRRLHSLLGLWLVLYLFEHLLVNSQAALWIGDDGHSFIRLVNLIQALPYLHAIELLFLGIPILVHGIWGVKRLFQAKENVSSSDGSKPSLPYARNHAYRWQRITSWILLFGIIGHVLQMRFLETPQKMWIANQERSVIKLKNDEHLSSLAHRLGVILYRSNQLEPELISFSLSEKEVLASAPSPGAALLLMVRETFKNPLMIALYTLFVLAAAFHACNGFWTFLITWGIILSYPSQKAMSKLTIVGMILLSFFGLAAIWGSYFL